MTLKTRFKTREEIPGELQPHYVEQAGEWVLDHDGRAKLDEFRQNNITLTKSLRTATDELEQMQSERQRLEEAAQLKAGEVDKVIEARTKAALTAKEKEFAPVVAERDALNGKLSALLIDQAVVTEATKRGLRATALPDITARARSTFKLVAGVPQAFDGDTLRVGHDGASPLTLAEWVEALVSSAPHLFEANAGSGAAGSGSGGAGNRSVKNPFRKESWNLTEQMKLQKTDPALAARLKAAA